MAFSKLVTIGRIFRCYTSFKADTPCTKALIISPGGVGTTFLMEHISSYLHINCPYDTDGLKHLPNPPSVEKLVYITGDFDDIFMSLKRRRWIINQAIKLRSFMSIITFGSWQKYFFKRAILAQDLKMTGDKVFRLQYDEIWNNKEQLASFLEIDDARFITDFPKRKRRTEVK